MLRSLLGRIQSLAFTRPLTVLAISGGLLLIALALGSQVEFRKSRSELAPDDDPDQQRWGRLLDEYEGTEALIACVEADPEAARDADAKSLQAFVGVVAEAVANDESVAQVFYRVDRNWFYERGLYLMPPDDLSKIVDRVRDQQPLLDLLGSVDGFPALNRVLSGQLSRSLESGAADSGQDADLTPILNYLKYQNEFLADPVASVSAWTDVPFMDVLGRQRYGDEADGYLKTYDGLTYFILITPAGKDDSLDFRRGLLATLGDRIRDAQIDHPGFRVVFTGQPALVVAEMDSVKRDTFRTSFFAIFGVALLTYFVFRWRTHVWLVLTALAVGIAWSFGAVWIELGYLNMITSSFISTLVGIGVAYGIHPVSEYELEGGHTIDPLAAARNAFKVTGPAVTVAAVTTSVAFLSIQLMRFRGFSELGLVAGVGVLLCWIAAAWTLPALIVVFGRSRARRRARVGAERGRSASAVDRIWVERMAGKICHAPRLVVGLALVWTVVSIGLMGGIRFDTNILDLLPQGSESLSYQRRMALESRLSPLYNIVVAESMNELSAQRARAAEEPTILRFESALEFLPEDVEESHAGITELGSLMTDVRFPSEASESTAADWVSSCRELENAFLDALDAAFTAGLSDLVEPLDSATTEAATCVRLAAETDDARHRVWQQQQQRLIDWMQAPWGLLQKALRADPPTLDTLPSAIRARYFTRSGKPLGFLYPDGDVFDQEFLTPYIEGSQRVAADATGFPRVFHKMAGRITGGFYRSVGIGAFLVAIILWIDFRNLTLAALALLPLGMGVVWMLGFMRIFGLQFNFANLVAVPLIIGVGIDNGVHVIHRTRLEGAAGMEMVLRHTGRAILIASLTTMIGFGSLALASHRGIASLGLVLLLGVGSCLITSTIVLPNLLVALGIARKRPTR
ncbi:MAG: MMPL family transporter [Acidobacteriota bacterium]|nr:MMPL family transporter [Acidobacteriota bacterium]